MYVYLISWNINRICNIATYSNGSRLIQGPKQHNIALERWLLLVLDDSWLENKIHNFFHLPL